MQSNRFSTSRSPTIAAEPPQAPVSDRFRRACLILGVTVGCVFSAFQILHDIRVPLGPGTAARVNGHLIDADSVNRTVLGMGNAGDNDARHRVVSRMIDEELLVQHALDTGAAQNSPEVRAALVRSAITRLNSETAAEPISPEQLRQYFASHSQAYAGSGKFDITPFYFESADFPDLSGAVSRAALARAKLMSGVAADAASHAADTVLTDALAFVPPGPLVSAQTLTTYFGADVAQVAQRLAPAAGGISQPTPFGRGVLLIRLNRFVAAEAPSLTSVHDLVMADALRDRQERALEKLLVSLRASAQIDYSNSPPTTAAR
jgi:hypothetical protein